MRYKAVVDGYVLDGLKMHYMKMMITESGSTERKARVI
jgi:hypothetical protein